MHYTVRITKGIGPTRDEPSTDGLQSPFAVCLLVRKQLVPDDNDIYNATSVSHVTFRAGLRSACSACAAIAAAMVKLTKQDYAPERGRTRRFASMCLHLREARPCYVCGWMSAGVSQNPTASTDGATAQLTCNRTISSLLQLSGVLYT
jgi:hypothetical protein